MRKVIVSNLVSLDGCYAGANGEIDWFVTGEEFFDYGRDLINQVDTLLFGRVTCEGMAAYWITPSAAEENPFIADAMNNLPKVVFSRTVDTIPWGKWNNVRVVKNSAADEIHHLKQQPGKDMVIYGSGSLVASLTQQGLIDEYQLVVCPVLLGTGKRLFAGLDHTIKLKLLKTQSFSSGSVLHYYQPDHR